MDLNNNKQIEIEEYKDAINNLITCKVCKQVLEEPVLSCHEKNVCLKHLNISEKRDYYCYINGRYLDKELQNLIDKKNDILNKESFIFGLNNKLAKDSCEILKPILDEAKLLSKDPANFVHEFFNDLKYQIDLEKEQTVEKIEEKYEKIMNEVLEFEKECKFHAINKVINLDQIVQEADKTLKKWNESLNQLDIDSKDDEWKSIRFEATKEIKKLEDEMEKSKNDLSLNKDFSFKPYCKGDKYFGNFYAKNYEIGKISMVLKIFSSSKPKFIIKSKKLVEDIGLFIIDDLLNCHHHGGKKLEAEIAFKIHEIEARKTNFLKKNSKVKHDL